MACADVTSANVCGYNNVGLKAGATAVAPSFVTIGKEGVALTSIKPTGLPTGYKGAINIQTLTAYGEKDQMWYYHEGETGRGAKADGWWLENATQVTPENDKIFKIGEGLWVTGLNGAKLTSSGEVLTSELVVELRAGATMIANPFAAGVKLTSIKPINLPAGYKGAINIQTLTAYGEKDQMWYYHEGETGRGAKADGWWLENSTQITTDNDVEFAAGAALWTTGIDGTSLKIPCPYKLSE